MRTPFSKTAAPIDAAACAPDARLTLRAMAERDVPEAMRIERAAFRFPWSETHLRSELEHEWARVLLAEEHVDGRPVPRGFVVFWLVCGELQILNVAVDPLVQRRGIARHMLLEAIAQARAVNAQLATLEVRRSNLPAIRLYESLGFQTTGMRPHYYEEEDEDALLMSLDIAPSTP